MFLVLHLLYSLIRLAILPLTLTTKIDLFYAFQTGYEQPRSLPLIISNKIYDLNHYIMRKDDCFIASYS